MKNQARQITVSTFSDQKGTPGQNDLPSTVQISFNIAPGETIHLTIEAIPPEKGPLLAVPEAAPNQSESTLKNLAQSLARRVSSLRIVHPAVGVRAISLEAVLFSLVLLVYLVTRLVGLAQFPIYFFTDEAIQTVQAADLVRDGFHNADHELLPTYFVNGGQYNLSLSVYLQVIPYIIFGKSVLATRGAAVMATLVGAVCIGLILKDIFKIRYWWIGTLILSITPAWLLHSRTAFESALMVSMYTGFLYFYLRYRYISPRNLYPAVVFGALAFYSYSGGQMVLLATALLLFFSDLRYHWQNRKTGLVGLGVLVVVALPYIRFLIAHGAANYNHLQILNSYWTEPLSLVEKIRQFCSFYLQGLNPAYWFLPNDQDLIRHLMSGYGHLLRLSFPFFLLGLVICVKNMRSASHRTFLIALLAAPTGAALVGIGITRLLVFVIPAVLMTSLGVWACLSWLEKRRIPGKALAFGLFIPLVAFNIYMLRDALENGPLWYSNYGLGGMQYGANQVFTAAQDYEKQHPSTQIILSPSWANGTDVLARFFLPDPSPIILGSIQGYFYEHVPLDEKTLFIMIPQEYAAVEGSNKFTDIHVEKIIPYPDGSPGFYFVRLRYVADIDDILQAEKAARSKLQTGEVTIDDEQTNVNYSMLDMGQIQNAFDGNEDTLIRSFEANPLVIELVFPYVKTLTGITVRVGGVATEVTALVEVQGAANPAPYKTGVPQTPLPKDAIIDFGNSLQVQSIHLEIDSVNDSAPAHVHVWEITLK